MERNKIFEQLKGYVDQLEQMTKASAEQLPSYSQPQQKQPDNKLMDDYNGVLEQEFIKDEMGQVFARVQLEAAQKYLIELYMATPEGKKLSEERAHAFRSYKDEKLKAFLESKKTNVELGVAPDSQAVSA